MLDWVNRIAFNDSSPLESQGYENHFGFQRHKPKIMDFSHWHGHIEINYLFNCSADYLINGKRIHVPEGKMIIFWASIPHQMIASAGKGEMINVYIPLEAFLSWKFPGKFLSEILNGEVLVADSLHESDLHLTHMWERDLEKKEFPLTLQVIDEMRSRIRRMSVESYSTFQLSNSKDLIDSKKLVTGLPYIQKILRFIADNYDKKITIKDIAAATGLHPNYAMKLFIRVLKTPIKQYVNKLRLQHAQALLVDTNEPILNIALKAGFGSISRFYDIFHQELHKTPQQFRLDMIKKNSH